MRLVRWLDERAPRVGRLLGAFAALLLPWMVVLAVTLPATAAARRWSVAWVGLDLMQAVGLAVTGWLVARRHPMASLLAGLTAGLLLVDAWFDVATASTGWDYAMALSLAAVVELPLAALLLFVGYRAGRRAAEPGPAGAVGAQVSRFTATTRRG